MARKRLLASTVIDNDGPVEMLQYRVGTWWRQNYERFSFSLWPSLLSLVLAVVVVLGLFFMLVFLPWCFGFGHSTGEVIASKDRV
jgi:hypothetical protein